MGSWGTDLSIPVGLRKILQRKAVENGVRKTANVPVFRAEMLVKYPRLQLRWFRVPVYNFSVYIWMVEDTC